MINPNSVYGKYQTTTLTPEEAIIRLHEKVFERIERIKVTINELKAIGPLEFEKKKEQLEAISRELELILESIDVIKGMLSDETPDHSTICRFRRSLPRECMEELLLEINSQLEEKGFIVRGRKERVVDATLVRSACRSRKYIEGEIVEDRKEEEVESGGGSSIEKVEGSEAKEEVHYSKDKEASWVKKGQRYHYGHKVMLSVDVKGFFHNAIIETAKVSDMKLLIPLLSKMELCEETLIIGDKGFSSKENREYIEEKGCVDLLMHKKPRGKKLPNCLKTLNKAISKVRYVVEQSIGILKLHLGLERFRYIGQEENLKEVFIAGMALNAKKAVRLMV